MKTIQFVFLITMVAFCVGCKPSQKANPTTETKVEEKTKQYQFSYLKMNGEFVLTPNDSISVNDPRNLSKILLSTSNKAGTLTEMTFFSFSDVSKKLAKCGYQFIGSKPDPYYYPTKSKTSIWDVFEKVKDYEGDCSKFKYVISRSPHDNPIHMHLRYGDNVEELLNMSKDPKDNKFNPWWADYTGVN